MEVFSLNFRSSGQVGIIINELFVPIVNSIFGIDINRLFWEEDSSILLRESINEIPVFRNERYFFFVRILFIQNQLFICVILRPNICVSDHSLLRVQNVIFGNYFFYITRESVAIEIVNVNSLQIIISKSRNTVFQESGFEFGIFTILSYSFHLFSVCRKIILFVNINPTTVF